MKEFAGKPKDLGTAIRDLRRRLMSGDGLARRQAAREMGKVASFLAQEDLEAGRNLCRRLFWSLNAESGEIGWGAAEALGEIMAESKPLAREFGHLLVSLIAEGENRLKDPALLDDAARGLDRLLMSWPETVPGAEEALAALGRKEE
jgi:hypothetical protein